MMAVEIKTLTAFCVVRVFLQPCALAIPSNPACCRLMEKIMDKYAKQIALVRAGIAPSSWGKRKGTQSHKNRMREAKMGVSKHKSRLFWEEETILRGGNDVLSG
jgi:hypothetical protein